MSASLLRLSPTEMLNPNDGRGAFVSTRTLLLAGCAILLVTGGCNKSTKAAQVNLQKICTFQMSAGEQTTTHDTRDWNLDMDDCVIILDTETGED